MEKSQKDKFHLAILLPDSGIKWQGVLHNLKPKKLKLQKSTHFLITQLKQRLPYVFYSKEYGIENTQLWIGKPENEEEAIDLSNSSRFVIGVHNQYSINERIYEQYLKCARLNLINQGSYSYIPVYIGVKPPSSVSMTSSPVQLYDSAKCEEKQEDKRKIHTIVTYIESSILLESLNFTVNEDICSETTLVPINTVPKKYLYCMIGDTSSDEAKDFQKMMDKELQIFKESSAIYQGFWDWESEPGMDIEKQLEEKLEQSHFVIAIYQNGDSFPLKHRLQSAFKYHLEESKTGDTDTFIPVLLTGVKLPFTLNIMSALDFSANHMDMRKWSKLTKTVCGNLSMLHVSPFQKFDYCVHEGLNIFNKVILQKDSSVKCKRLDSFILHTEHETNNMLNHMITEIIECDKPKNLQGKYMNSMTERTNFVMQLIKQSAEQLTSHLMQKDCHQFKNESDYIFISNKLYMSTKIMLVQLHKLSFVCTRLEIDCINAICEVAAMLAKLPSLHDSYDFIADPDFSYMINEKHISHIWMAISQYPTKLRNALKALEMQMHSMTDKTCNTCVLERMQTILEILVSTLKGRECFCQRLKLAKVNCPSYYTCSDVKKKIKKLLITDFFKYITVSHIIFAFNVTCTVKNNVINLIYGKKDASFIQYQWQLYDLRKSVRWLNLGESYLELSSQEFNNSIGCETSSVSCAREFIYNTTYVMPKKTIKVARSINKTSVLKKVHKASYKVNTVKSFKRFYRR